MSDVAALEGWLPKFAYDHRFAQEDSNVNLPFDRLAELVEAGENSRSVSPVGKSSENEQRLGGSEEAA